MPTTAKQVLERLIFKQFQNNNRFTQDSPVYPDVWMEYFEKRASDNEHRADLILTPHRKSSAPDLFTLIADRLREFSPDSSPDDWKMASTGETVIARLTFRELIVVALPLTAWWQALWKNDKKVPADLIWLSEVAGALLFFLKSNNQHVEVFEQDIETLRKEFAYHFESFEQLPLAIIEQPVALFSVSRNRNAKICINQSVPATKADASRRVFDIDGTDIAWAILDTGIDARHPAFRKRDKSGQLIIPPMGPREAKDSNNTRIIATYDFTQFRDLLATIYSGKNKTKNQALLKFLTKNTGNVRDERLTEIQINNLMSEIESDLHNGRLLDWSVMGPLLRIPHNDTEYEPPVHHHGTHVAGILGAGIQKGEEPEGMLGMCPGIDLYDIRVLNAAGEGDEFNILAAIQFVRWMNNQKDGIIIHGINLSLSMFHDVASYACGQTPVCEACDRLVSEGAVVVAAAGNLGQSIFQSTDGLLAPGFRMVNITDPGNADLVITVGATHRNRPHSYGVSYFSSKGPTGDGRSKPDLVAPGEKITSCIGLDETDRFDGTSMAAPHVSGAAALLLAKHRELIGKPRRVKEILCNTATDLGREKYFQGAGMVDVMRAIQSV